MTGIIKSSVLRTSILRTVALGAVVAVVLAFSVAEAKADINAHVTINNQGCGCADVFCDGQYLGHVEGHRSKCFHLHRCGGDCFTVMVRGEWNQMLAARHIHVQCGCTKNVYLTVH